MKTQKLTFHCDPSHAWLEVSIADLESLGITGLISAYSYAQGDKAYLEEDCDADLYIQGAKAAGWTIQIVEKYTGADSLIRRMESFKVPA
jgi:hypothetical protein